MRGGGKFKLAKGQGTDARQWPSAWQQTCLTRAVLMPRIKMARYFQLANTTHACPQAVVLSKALFGERLISALKAPVSSGQ